MLCPKCGHENSDGARFCAKCGSPIRTAADANGADTTTIMDSGDKDVADKTTVMDGTGAGDTDQTTVADGSDETVVMGDPAKVGAPVSQSTNEEPIDETAPTTEGSPLPAGAVITQSPLPPALSPLSWHSWSTRASTCPDSSKR